MRIEFYGKSPSELASIALLVLQNQSQNVGQKLELTGFNLPNKAPNDPLLHNANHISQSISSSIDSKLTSPDGIDLCVHYSLKYNADKRPEDTIHRFQTFLLDAAAASTSSLTAVDATSSRIPALPLTKVLLVSGGPGGGGKPKKKCNTVTCLQACKEQGFLLPDNLELGVAYNPYWPAPEHKEDEYTRLLDKLRTEYITHIWINFGSDTGSLELALSRLRAEPYVKQKKVRLIGSLMVPSKALLAKFRFRPWSGLFLSDDYLATVDGAQLITKEIMRIYKKNDVEILIESPIRTCKDMVALRELVCDSNSITEGDIEPQLDRSKRQRK